MIEIVQRNGKRVIRPKYVGNIQNNWARRAAMLAVALPLWVLVILVGMAFIAGQAYKGLRMMVIDAPIDLTKGFIELYNEPRKP